MARPRSVGPYRLLEPLGEGGMGEVYRAEQTAPIRRTVAVKVIRPGMASAAGMTRFDAERRALARMTHPAIAGVFDAGETEDGRPYFVMEYVEGEPITDYCARRDLDVAARLELFVEVCAGIQHAHHKGIIHRDLKPSNILVTGSDGRPRPKIIDFGIAKAVDSVGAANTLVSAGRIVGTPAYMSPEQADGRDALVDTRTDVYALGAILYELLAGAPPCDPEALARAGRAEMVRLIVEGEPPPPSVRVAGAARARHLAGDLDAIVLKALEKETDRRYDSAEALARDLARHLSCEPVAARRQTALYRTGKFARKHRVLVTAATLVGLALVVGVAVSLGLYLQAEEARAGREAARRASVRDAERADRDAREAERHSTLAAERLRRVLRLADAKRLADVRRKQAALWPSHPRNAEALAACLEEARALVRALPEHRQALAALRAEAVGLGEPARPGGLRDPLREELATLRRSRGGKLRELSRLWAATALRFPSEPADRPSTYYFRTTARVSEADAAGPLELRVQAADGVVVYVNGEELVRGAMPEGPPTHATRAVRRLGESFVVCHVPPGRFVAGANTLAVRVHLAAAGANRDVHLALDLRCGRRELLPLDTTWRYHDGGTDPGPRWAEVAFDDRGWASGAAPLGAGRAAMLSPRYRESRGRLQRSLADLDGRIAAVEARLAARRTPQFADTDTAWQFEALADLVRGIEALAASDAHGCTVPALEARHARAVSIREASIDRPAAAWRRAIRAIAASPHYGGRVIREQIGLVPLGPDPDSGLWEFAHLETGPPPRRGADGRLALTDESGLVFVLLPGGTSRLGAVRPGKSAPGKSAPVGAPHVDRWARDVERPVTSVRLEPFFIAKHEMTQAQWTRFTGRNPSLYCAGQIQGGRRITARHPVEQVSWRDCRGVLRRLGLTLPTEAQWEYAARGGTTTPWWCGEEPASIRGAANWADLSAVALRVVRRVTELPEVDDGHALHAPVGTLRPNPFGLHDVIGNVSEWCRDRNGKYDARRRAGDGEILETVELRSCVLRGGCFRSNPTHCRSAHRNFFGEGFPVESTGVRPARELQP